jgi:hypothetical protein
MARSSAPLKGSPLASKDAAEAMPSSRAAGHEAAGATAGARAAQIAAPRLSTTAFRFWKDPEPEPDPDDLFSSISDEELNTFKTAFCNAEKDYAPSSKPELMVYFNIGTPEEKARDSLALGVFRVMGYIEKQGIKVKSWGGSLAHEKTPPGTTSICLTSRSVAMLKSHFDSLAPARTLDR